MNDEIVHRYAHSGEGWTKKELREFADTTPPHEDIFQRVIPSPGITGVMIDRPNIRLENCRFLVPKGDA